MELLDKWAIAEQYYQKKSAGCESAEKNYNDRVIEYAQLQQSSSKKYQECVEATGVLDRHLRKVWIKLDEVSNRQNETISTNLTADEQITFYKGWDAWIGAY